MTGGLAPAMASESVISLLDGEIELAVSDILGHCYAGDGDVVLLGGSLVEGVGNRYSDVDVHVFVDRLPTAAGIDFERHHRVITPDRSIVRPGDRDAQVYLIHTVIPGSFVKIDVEFKLFSEMDRLARTVASIYDYAVDNLILLTKTIPIRDQNIIHRLFSGKCIFNHGRFRNVMSMFDRDQYCYLGYRWVASDFSILLDLIGAWSAGELDRSVDIARENAIKQMYGYLNLRGQTNVRRKWLIRYVLDLPDDASDLREAFFGIFYGARCTDVRSGHDYLSATLDFVDAIYARSAELLAANPLYPSGAEALAMLRPGEDTLEQYAKMEIAYRAKAYGLAGAPTRSVLPGFGSGT